MAAQEHQGRRAPQSTQQIKRKEKTSHERGSGRVRRLRGKQQSAGRKTKQPFDLEFTSVVSSLPLGQGWSLHGIAG
jgi:hypothetical protein